MAQRYVWKLQVGGEDFATYEDVFVPGKFSGGPQVETVPLATNDPNVQPARFARGNSVAEIPFTFTKLWPDNQQAADFAVRGPMLWNGVKSLTLTKQNYDGSETVWDFAAAEFKIEVLEPIGVTTITTGIIRGLPVLSA